MPPRRYVLLISPLVLLLLLIIVQQNDQSANPVLAQHVVDPMESNSAALGPNDLTISLVAINNSPSGSPEEVKSVGEQVTFTATVTDGSANGLTFFWNFGDGQTAQGQVTQHVYAKDGIYSAFVIATDGMYSKRATTSVTIKPIVTPRKEAIEGLNGTSDSPTTAGNPTNFLATVEKGSDVTYEWNFGDPHHRIQATGVAASHIYSQPGDYLVTVAARNVYGPPQTKSFWVWIFEAPPRGLTIRYIPSVISVDSEVTFTATVESGTNVNFDWSVSDGSSQETGPVIRHRFSKIGVYEVRVRASNSAGEIFTTLNVEVRDNPPVILRVLPETPKSSGEAIFFSAFVLSDSQVQAEWRWGDKSTTSTTSEAEQSDLSVKEIRASHQYAKVGRYLITLIVQNSGGSTATELKAYVNVDPPLQTTRIDATPENPVANEPVTYTVPLEVNKFTCDWDLGDGTTQKDGNIRLTHTYTESKKYLVYVKCISPDKAQIYDAERIIFISGGIFMPLIARNGAFVPSAPSGGSGQPGQEPTATFTPTPTETAVPTVTDTPIPTIEAPPIPSATATDTPTDTPVPMPTETETATATPTEELGGTIPQVTPTDTPTEEPGGTIPKP